MSKGEEKLPIFKYITDHNVNFVKNALAKKNSIQKSTDIQRVLADKGKPTSILTVQKVIKAAGYTASSSRYGQIVREPNKLKRVLFYMAVIADNDNFDKLSSPTNVPCSCTITRLSSTEKKIPLLQF